jgi:branched-chain amino acid transport system permease protein
LSDRISLGGAYALIAIGYTMVYGILRLINFAHGDLFMIAGYLMIFTLADFPWYIAIPIVLIGTVVIGIVIERLAYKPLRSAPRMSIMISAIGVSLLLQNLATYLFTALPRGYPEIPYLKTNFPIWHSFGIFCNFSHTDFNHGTRFSHGDDDQ